MLCGIDEAGRGPIAGPLVVAGAVLLEEIIGLNDSKVLSEKKREKLFEEIIIKSKYHIVFTNAKKIDEKGLSFCLKNSIMEIMKNLENSALMQEMNVNEMQEVNGGWVALALAVAGAAIYVYNNWDDFCVGVNEGWNGTRN